MSASAKITALSDVPADTTFLFRVRPVDDAEEREAILVRADGNGAESSDGEADDDGDESEVAGWLNYCQHFTHITLDKGSGAEMRDGEVICTNHGAYFEADTGQCTFGPCEGAFLTEIDVRVEDGAVYLVDDDYTFVAADGIETDDAELGSRSNYEF